MNNDLWQTILLYLGPYLNFSAYVIYNIIYSGMLFHIIWSTTNISNQKMQNLAINALCHTLFSLAGIFCYAFYVPNGVIEQNILVVGAIHVFLNWGTIPGLVRKYISPTAKNINGSDRILVHIESKTKSGEESSEISKTNTSETTSEGNKSSQFDLEAVYDTRNSIMLKEMFSEEMNRTSASIIKAGPEG